MILQQKSTENRNETTDNNTSAFHEGQPHIPLIQRQCDECEEEIQMKPSARHPIQMQPQGEEEELLQPKIRMQPIREEEDEILQPKSDKTLPTVTDTLSSRLNQSKNGGQQLPNSTNQFMSHAFGSDFSSVKVHTDSEATAMNRQLGAKAFTHGNDVYFNEGKYNPTSADGKKLIAHELTHVVQQNGSKGRPGVQRAMINDAAGNPTAYEFRIGTELNAGFVAIARPLTGDGTVSDADLRSMRSEAMRSRGTLNDHERMFMAGLLDPANVTTFNSSAVGANFQFPSSSITTARLNHVIDLDRTIPANVQKEFQDVLDALSRGDLSGMATETAELERVATQAIRNLAGSFTAQANLLIGYLTANTISTALTVTAMVRAASDNSSGDRVLAGIVYAIAAQASHPFALRLQHGDIKVDALIPRALAALPGFTGREEAAYVTAAQASGAKGDTMYVKTDLDPTNVYHRSVVIHELRHAQDDAGSTATGRPTFPIKNQLEARAYRSQASYIYRQLSSLPVAQQSAAAAQIAGGVNSAVVVALVLEGKTNTAVNQALFTMINGHIPAANRLSAAQITAAFALSVTSLETRLINIINSLYGLSNTDVGVVDGLAGESLVDWIYRI